MTQTKHTPGPWDIQSIDTSHNGYADWPTFAIRSQITNVCLAEVGHVDHYQSERNSANASLIAAAPELLNWLKAWVEAEQDSHFEEQAHDPQGCRYCESLQIIAKAEGR